MKYTGREMESMDFAVNYHRWILEIFRPFLGKRIVEVGAGTGAFSQMLMETNPESLTMLEPSANLFPLLVERMGSDRALQGTLREASVSNPDSILYVNVLEHVENDEAELADAHSLLAPSGRVFIFVPANRWLMSDMDRLMGHHRRYTLAELSLKCRSAGFNIRYSSPFDVLGIIPWLVKYRLLGSTTMESGLVKLYDSLVVPVARVVEGIIAPPVGKSIILIGEKN
jgi:hypothetical protein